MSIVFSVLMQCLATMWNSENSRLSSWMSSTGSALLSARDWKTKVKAPTSIVMSATPIPRTLALTLYGDLERIVIDEMPSRKAEVITKFVPPPKNRICGII